jgi:hypothetical protein
MLPSWWKVWYYFRILMFSELTCNSTFVSLCNTPTPPLCAGKRFYAHRIALLASSDAFRAMFDGGYRVSSEAWYDTMCFCWLEAVAYVRNRTLTLIEREDSTRS